MVSIRNFDSKTFYGVQGNLQEDTGYRRIQEDTGGYRRIHEDTGGYRPLK